MSNRPYLDPFGDYQSTNRTIGFILIGIIIIVILLFCDSCAHQSITFKGHAEAITGTYKVYECDCSTVQSKYLQYGGNPRITVEACTVWTREGKREIYYCTERGREEEFFNIRSYKNLIRAHRYDERKWLQIAPPNWMMEGAR